MAGFYIDLPFIPVSFIRAIQRTHIWRCYRYVYHNTKNRLGDTKGRRAWFGIMLTISYVVYGRGAFSNYSKGFQTNVLHIW